MESPKKRGFCPRVWTPMQSGDGLIVRVHPGLSNLSVTKVRALITLAERHGNGQLDVTRRANLQLRGVRESELGALQTALVESGWAAASEAGERHFALLTSPLIGLDRASGALLALAEALEQALLSDAASPLHPKLCIALDDGARRLSEVAADLWLVPIGADARELSIEAPNAQRARVRLGQCAREDLVALVLRVLTLLSAGDAPLRIHEWLAQAEPAQLTEALGLSAQPHLSLVQQDAGVAPSETLVGYHTGERPWFGLLLPFGSGSASEWRALCELSARFGSGRLRVTTRREVLLLDVPAEHASALAERADQAGFIRDERDPLLRTVACTGAPKCGAAQGETRQLARMLAAHVGPLLARGGTLHVSGCEKSCALSGPSALTLVHSPRGLHVLHDATASAALSAPALSLAEAEAALRREYATPAPLDDSETPP